MQVRSFLLVVFLLLLALAFGCSRQPVAPAEEDIAVSTEETSEPAESDVVEAPTSDASTEAADDPTVIATVNGRSIGQDDLESATDGLIAQYQQIYSQFGMDIRSMLAGAEGRVFRLRLQSEALDRLFFEALVKMELERRDIVPTEEEIDEEFETQLALYLESQNLTRELFETRLEEQGYVVEEFMATARENITEHLKLRIVQRAVSEPIEISDDELLAYFEEHRAEYETEEEVRASHILVATEEEAVQLHLQLADGADFAELAREHSTDVGSGQNGGDLGWFGRGRMVAAFEEAAFALEVGQLSEIVQTEFGFHIILLTDHRDATHPEYVDVADRVLEDREAEIIEERFGAWYEGIYAEAETDVLDPLISAMRLRMEDIDAGLAAFEQIKIDGTVREPYLSYIIGAIYEEKLREAEAEKSSLETGASEETDVSAQMAELEQVIADTLEKALAAYRDALADFGGTNDEIEAKIENLDPPKAEADSEADPAADGEAGSDAEETSEAP